MNNQAIIATIEQLDPISGADRILAAKVAGATVIVGIDTKVGDIGVYFPIDVQLSEQFCKENNLFSHPEFNKDTTKKGYFSDKRRVRAQKFKGVKSEGLFLGLDCLDWFNVDENKIKELIAFGEFKPGFSFNTLFGVEICRKYESPATIRVRAEREAEEKRSKKPRRTIESFLKHKDTNHFEREVKYIPDGSLIYITEKLHGTSARFGNVWVEEDRYNASPKWKQILSKLGLINLKSSGYQFVNGTRNTILGKVEDSFYGNESFRETVVKDVKDKLFEGETIYGEIVGYAGSDQLIMPAHSTKELKDKEISKTYGDKMVYRYGCTYTECRLYVYRITRTDRFGNYVEYSWPQVKARCKELGLEFVPECETLKFCNKQSYQFSNNLQGAVDYYIEGPSLIDSTHIREGVVLRVEPPEGKPYWLKSKSMTFKILEGILKEQDDVVDMEEAS